MISVFIFIKKYKKVIGIALGILIIICSTLFISGKVSEAKFTKLYKQLEDGYSSLEDSNREFREINSKLEDNNKLLREQIAGANTDIRRANIIVGDFEKGLSEARDTVERIEITLGFIDRIIEQLPSEIIILEEGNGSK